MRFSGAIPGPVSRTLTSMKAPTTLETTVSVPPLFIASQALRAMFTNDCRNWPKSALIGGIGGRSFCSTTFCMTRRCESSDSASSTTALTSSSFRLGGRCRAKSSRLRTIALHRSVSRCTRRRFRVQLSRAFSDSSPSSCIRISSFA